MSHIVLGMDDVELSIEVVGALEDSRHVVEHVFDGAEALLRARLLAIDALVLDLAMHIDQGMMRRWIADAGLPLVLLANSRAGERLARQLGATFCERPTSDAESLEMLVDVIETAIRGTDASALRRVERTQSGTQAIPDTILIAARGSNARSVCAAVVREQLGLGCVPVESAAEAVAYLAGAAGPNVRAVLIDPMVVLDGDEGAELHALLRRTGMPAVPLKLGAAGDDDAVVVGRAAWDAVPHLRKALAARVANDR